METSQTISSLTHAMQVGSKIGASRQVNLRLVGLLREQFGEHWPQFFDTEFGAALFELVAPVALHFAATNIPGFPAAPHVTAVCEYAMIGGSEKATEVVISKFLPVAEELASWKLEVGDEGSPVSAKGRTSKG